MAKICKDIFCNNKYFRIDKKGELICGLNNHTVQIMEYCRDFDAVEENGCIHIAATDKEGNLIYIINDNEHWGRGIAAPGVMAENLFVQREQGNTVVYYVSGGGLYKISLDTDAGQPVLLDEILCSAMPFVCQNTVYYINKNEKLCTNEGREICSGADITHIFATVEELCIKDKNRLDLINATNFENRQGLTRRHGGRAQCPVIVSTGEAEILCWCDGGDVFFSKKEGEIWHSLETLTPENTERLGIFKFDGKYDLGCLKNGQVCSFNIKE